MRFEKDILSSLAILTIIFTPTVFSCSCLPAHPQEHYCKSDFVLLVKVKNLKIVSHSAMYRVNVKKTFKTSDKVNSVLKGGQIWTASSDALCGVKLHPNKQYLITGSLSGGKAWTSLCNYQTEWSKLTMKQRKGFRLLYKHGCECKTAFCMGKFCRANANTCLINDRDSTESCQALHSICIPQENGQCQWNKSRAYRECIRNKHWRNRLEP